MLPLIAAALGTPALVLRLNYFAPRVELLSPVIARKLRGALNENLKQLSAMGTLGTLDRSGIGKPGLHLIPFALRVPWTTALVGPEEPLGCEVLLMGEAAAEWVTVARAASQVSVEGTRLECPEPFLATPEGLLPAGEVAACPLEVVRTVEDFTGSLLHQVSRLRLHLISPTAWGAGCLDPQTPISPRDLVRSGFRRLMNLTGQPRSPQEQRLQDALAEGLRVEHPAVMAVKAWYPSTRQHGHPVNYGGLLGHFDLTLESAAAAENSGRYLAPELLALLRVLEVVHLGKDSALGCGRISIEPRGSGTERDRLRRSKGLDRGVPALLKIVVEGDLC